MADYYFDECENMLEYKKQVTGNNKTIYEVYNCYNFLGEIRIVIDKHFFVSNEKVSVIYSATMLKDLFDKLEELNSNYE